MKQISEEEEKPLTSSLNICSEACSTVERGGGRAEYRPPPYQRPLFPSLFVNISLKDDVTVILLLSISIYYFKSERLAEIKKNK